MGAEGIFDAYDGLGKEVSEGLHFVPDELTEQLLELNGSLENYTDSDGTKHIYARNNCEQAADPNDTWEYWSFPGDIFPLDAMYPNEI